MAALLAALSFMFVQLALAQNSSAATGDVCARTGMETVASDAEDYPPGSTAHFSGTGYTADCDIQLNIARPDGVVDSVTATTDLFGNFTADYPLPPPPGVIGPYHLDVIGYAGATLAAMDFTDANNDGNIAPEWAPGNTVTTFNTLYRVTNATNVPVQHVRITLPSGYLSISVGATAFSSGTWGTPVVNQANRTVDVSLTSGTGLGVGGWARIDLTATTPASQTGNAARWLLQTFTDAAGTTGEQNDNPPVLVNDTTNPSATITFVDGSGNPISNPVFQNNQPATVRVRITQSGSGIKYVDVAIPTCFSSATGVTTTVSTGGNGGYTPIVTDGFIRMPGGQIPTNGFLTVQFTTTPACTSGLYTVTTSPSTNASNPPSGTNQSVSETGGSLTVAAGKADLSIAKVDSPDPVAINGTLTYTLNVANGGPDDASAVKVEDTLPAGVTFQSASGTNWTCSGPVSGKVTCNHNGNVAVGNAEPITIVVSAPGSAGSITNNATVSSPNDVIPGNNSDSATTAVQVADLSITKTDAPDPVQTNANLTYTINVTNNSSTVPATSLSVSDTIPGGTTFVSASGAGWSCSGTSTVTCTRASLAAGASASFDIVVKAPGTAATLSNTASVTSPSDNITGNNSATTTTTVTANRAPSLTAPTFSPASPKTNDNLTASTTTSDPDGDQISVAWTWKITRGANTCTIQTNSSPLAAAGTRTASLDLSASYAGGAANCTGATPPATINPSKSDVVAVEARPTDAPGLSGTLQSNTVTIQNTAPTVTLSAANDLTVNEGTSHTYSYTISDPDGDAIASVSTSCGLHGDKSNASNTNTSGQFDCTFPDGPDSSTVLAQATDSGFGAGPGNSATQSVTINNVRPTISISGNANVNEGSAYSLTLGAISDPGTDTVTSWIVHWGDGSDDTYSSGGAKTHTYADGPNDRAITVDLVDEDGTFLDRANALSVHVNNVAPSITISGAANVNEGAAYSLTLGAISDPGNDTVASWIVHWGDGSDDTYSSGGAKNHTYADGPSTHAITVDLVDEDGTFLDRANALSVHVDNVAPSITISGNASVNEGSAYSLTLGSVTDPGADTVTSYVVHWGDGNSNTYSSNAGAKTHTYADGPSDHAITVDLTDEDDTFLDRANAFSVHVNNVAPSIAISGNANVNEGSTYTLNLGAVTDPGDDTVTSYLVHWGDGSSNTYSTNGDKTHTYADGPDDHSVTVDLVDEDGTFTNAANAFAVHVNNVAPSITISGAASVNEGSPYSLTLGAITDPGTDTVTSWIVHWGDGSTSTYGSGGAKTHTYADGPNDWNITVDLVDEDGTFLDRANPLSVHVSNVAPSITISGNASVNEGSAYTLNLGAISDPGSDTVTSWIVHWGDGSTSTYSSGGDKTHTYADGPSDHDVTVDLIDEDGTFLDRANAFSVHVNNVAPSIAVSGNANVNEGSVYTLTLGAVTDPGTDTVTSYEVHWGDGSSNTYSTNGDKTHTYADGPSDHAITVDLTDEDDTFLDRANAFSVHVNNVAPSIAISGAASVNEGSAYSLTLGAISDPGTDTVTSWIVHWGDGSDDTYSSGGAKTHTYADGPDDHAITVDLVDEDGTFLDRANAFSVHVNNVAPSITISGAASVDEGSLYTLTLGAVTDPGTDTVTSYVVHWGDGTTSSYGADGAKTHTYADGPNDWDITVDLVDEDGTFLDRANAFSVHVNNVAPSIAISGAANVNEGSPYSLTLGGVSDPGNDTVTSYLVHWGDGSSATYSSDGVKTHTYADGPDDHAITVDLVDEDGTFLNRANALSVHVNNVAPTVSLSGADEVTEGSTEVYSYTVTDPGDDTFSVNAGFPTCGDHGQVVGTPTVGAHGGSFECKFPDGPAESHVAVRVTDSDGASDTDSEDVVIVQVVNSAPDVTAAANQSSDEGESHLFDLGSFTDPGDDSPWAVTVDWGDGSFPLTSFTTATTGTIPSQSHIYADGPSVHTVTVNVNDGTDTTSKTFSVHVNNVAPSIAISGNANVNEGSAYTLNLGAVTDPGTDTVSSYVVHWGDGSTDTYATNGDKNHTYADGDSGHAITVDLTDEDDTFLDRANAFSVHVNNVAPSIAISANANVNEGSVYSLTLGAISDPGTDTVTSWIVHWGDGSTGTYLSDGVKTHTYADGPNTYPITVDLVDEDGTFLDRANPLSVHVDNVAPSIAISGAASVNEGSAYSLTLGAVSDPGSDTVSSYIVHWGDGSTDSYPSNGVKTHTYADGPADHDITVDLTDEDGTFTDVANDVSVHVNNVAPTIAISGNANVNEGSAYTLNLGAVTDPGTDTVSSYVVHWGDGSTDTYVSNGDKTHTYADGPNDYDITVDLTDEDGTFTDAANDLSVHVTNVAPTIAISGNANVNEGSAYSLTLGAVTDPGTDTVTQWIVDWGDGATSSYGAGGVKTHTYADGPNDYDITVDLADEDGTFTDAANDLSVHVNNVAPTVTFSASNDTSVTEGTTHTYDYTVTDPGQDTFTVDATYPKCGQYGTPVGTPTTTATGGSFQCNFPDGPNTTNLGIKVTDSDGASDTASEAVQIVNVANVAPSVTGAADQSSNEGASHSFDIGSFTDPGSDANWTVSIDWADGSFATTFPMSSPGTIPAQSHTYADGPSDHTVSVTVTDKNGAADTKTFKVHVNNVAPTVAFTSAPDSANEGQTKSYTYSISDPGADTVDSVSASCGSNGNLSSAVNNNTGGSFDCTFPDGDAATTVSVQATDSDHEAGNTASQPVTITNVAPSIAISGAASVNEGSPYSLTLGAVTDPGTDTVTSYLVHWGDGSDDTYSSNGVKTHTYADGPNDYAITVDLTDEDGTFLNRANALSVHVNNVAPTTPTLSSPADNSTTGDNTPTFDWNNSSDPAGANDTISYRILVDDNCDFSSPEINQMSSSSDFTPATSIADGTYCWKVSASDEDGGSSADSAVWHVTIDATVPTVVSINRANTNPTNASSVDWTVTFSESVSGVGAGDFTVVNGGLGGTPAITNVTGGGTTYTVTASTGSGSGTLGLNLVDDDSITDGAGNPLGGTGAGNGSFTGEIYTIDRSALTVTINQAAGQLDPTSTAPIKFAVVFNKPVTDFTNADVGLSSSTAGGTLIANVYDSGDHKTYEVRVNGMTTAGDVVINIGANQATDAAGNGNQAATIIDNRVTWNPAIGNNTPTVYIDSPAFGATYAKGTASITLKAHFTDPDNGPWTYTINWDDGTANSTGSLTASGQSFQANHSFPNTGVYTINVCVKDSVGASGCAQVWIVVYDPNGGFITGGGFINVGTGSYTADPTLTGRANFGFNSQYKKNANIPTGETEFNFQVGNFNFHSEAYTWLVVSGYKAQYKGTGSVNGVSGYDFTLTAYDGDITGGGGVDRFRIRITKTNGGNVVFDNKNGAPIDMDTADPQTIAGGSIVIHKA